MSSTQLPGSRFGEWISEGWRMFTEQWKAWVLLALGYFAVMLVPSVAVMFAVFSAAFANAASQAGPYGRSVPGAFPFSGLVIVGVTLLALVVLVPVSAFFKGGMYKSAFKQLRGGQLEFRDLFSAGDCFVPLLGETILVGLIVFIGSLFCLIPGFIAAGLLMFAAPLTVERRMGVIEAMQASYEMTKQNILIFTLFAFILQLIVSAGTYLCYVGVLATYPLMFTMAAVAYRDCFGLSGARSFRPLQASAIPPYATSNPYEPSQPQGEPMNPSVSPYTTTNPYDAPAHQSDATESSIRPYPTPMPYEAPAPQGETTESLAPPPSPPGSPEPTPQAPVPQGTSCPGCQTQLPSTATFCFRCGTKVRT